MVMRFLLPLTLRVEVQGIAVKSQNAVLMVQGSLHTVKGSLELGIEARRVLKLLDKL